MISAFDKSKESKTNYMIVKSQRKKSKNVNINLTNRDGSCHSLHRKDHVDRQLFTLFCSCEHMMTCQDKKFFVICLVSRKNDLSCFGRFTKWLVSPSLKPQ